MICAVQRSGSFLLCEALKNTGLAGVPEEYFLDGGSWEEGEWARQHGASSRADYLRLVFKKGATPNGVFGVKLMWNYFHKVIETLQELPPYQGMAPPELMRTLFSDPAYIWIVRRDKVRQAVSWARAAQTGVYAWPKGQLPIPQQEPVFDFTLIDNLHGLVLAGEQGWQEFFNACGVEPFKVVYEELVEAYEQTALDILDFLNIPYPDDLVFGERRLQKQADGLNEAWVERYLQLKQARNTHW